MCEGGAAGFCFFRFDKRSKKEENGEPGVLYLVVYSDDNQPTINPSAVDQENPKKKEKESRQQDQRSFRSIISLDGRHFKSKLPNQSLNVREHSPVLAANPFGFITAISSTASTPKAGTLIYNKVCVLSINPFDSKKVPKLPFWRKAKSLQRLGGH
uniref:Uncharacterized protein n=1 Tax=Ditylum brightwellii TaxID=49249 RepID=A0A7S4S8F6_9STRA|mmetsp:Transcript_17291/g.24617  ORF Transcript_17291/g.24617 Transcript_17291/m.24617 type:complete len:156 (+) Transcript_17291:165-632(+)